MRFCQLDAKGSAQDLSSCWKLPLPMQCDVLLHTRFCSPRSSCFQGSRTVWL